MAQSPPIQSTQFIQMAVIIFHYIQMSNDLQTIYSTTDKVSIWYLNQDKMLSFPPSLTLKQLKLQLGKINEQPKMIFYDWQPVNDLPETTPLSDIITESPTLCPSLLVNEKTFTVIDWNETLPQLEKKQTRVSRILSNLESIQQVDEKQIPKYDISKAGMVIFEGRQSALFASAINMALQNSNAPPQKLQALLQNNRLLSNNRQGATLSTIGLLFKRIGLINGNLKQQNQQEMIKLAYNLKSQKQFTDFDPKFIYLIMEIYLKFMIQSKGKIQYVDYHHVDDFQIQQIDSKSKIGIIGDFGTGLKDSIELLRNMILKHDVDVIFHLGDVYYAGTPQQYEISIVKPLSQLRIQAKKQIRFYSIPGNHDYYSWGLPFLCFVKGINQKEFQKQKASYFCIRDKEQKWQFLGMDSAINDSSPLNQVNPGGVGPFVQEKELLWHKHRLQNFKGSTILMTHHQLFSIHQRINGKLTKYRRFSCINPALCASMFKYMSNISAWFWGHQHSLMLFKDNLFGLSKGRLLGNSSFHVMYKKQSPYSRQKSYPYIPFIVQDKEYLEKYLPVNPTIGADDYFALSYALIDMGKIDSEGNLPIQYWCSPSFSNEQLKNKQRLSVQTRKKLFFEEFKLYEQKILSIQTLKKQRNPIKNHTNVHLRCEIGLALKLLDLQKPGKQQKFLMLNLSGSEFEIQIIDEKLFGHCILEFTLRSTKKQNNNQCYLGVMKNRVQLVEINSKEDLQKNNALWICENICPPNNTKQNQPFIFERQPVKIHNKTLHKSLTWKIVNNDAFPCLQEPQYQLNEEGLKIQRTGEENLQCLWMFERQKLISE